MSIRSIRFGLLVTAACLVSGIAAAGQSAQTSPTSEDCLACHGDADARRPDGRSMAVDAARFGTSIHAAIACADCHADAGKELPHQDRLAKVACGSCHDEVAGNYHDSMHAPTPTRGGCA